MRYNTSLYRTLVTGVRGHCPRVPAGGGRGSGNSGWRPNTGSPGSSSQFRSPILLSCNKVRRMGNGSSSWTQEMFVPKLPKRRRLGRQQSFLSCQALWHSLPLLDQVLTEVPPTMRALARQNFGRADDLALTPMRLGRGFCLTGRGEERKGNGW